MKNKGNWVKNLDGDSRSWRGGSYSWLQWHTYIQFAQCMSIVDDQNGMHSTYKAFCPCFRQKQIGGVFVVGTTKIAEYYQNCIIVFSKLFGITTQFKNILGKSNCNFSISLLQFRRFIEIWHDFEFSEITSDCFRWINSINITIMWNSVCSFKVVLLEYGRLPQNWQIS